VSSCLDRGPEALLGNTAPDPLERQVWTLILADDAGKVWIAQTDSAVAVHGESPAAATAALWSVLDSAPDFRDLRLTAQVDGRQMSWTLMRAGVPLGSGLGAMRAYVGSAGAPRFSGTASLELDGTRRSASFDAIGGLPMPAEPVVQAPRAAPPPAHGIVSLRADDCPATESQVLAFLRAAGLTAEFAVPTRLVGRPGRCTWATVDSLAAAGNAIEAHSRFHERSPATFGDFYIETIGSALDLVSRGHPAHLFIQPGSWLSGPPDLDDPSKLLTPYAALLRRTFVGIEAYAVPGTSLWRAQFSLMYEIDEHVARLRLRLVARIDEGKVVRRASAGPDARTLRPLIQLLRWIGGGKSIVASLQPGIDDVAREIGDGRKILSLSEDGADAFFAQQLDEFRRAEARVARLDHMT
jgi:hypothetical protein